MADTMTELADRYYNNTNALTARLLNQMARELLLAQSSDWAFLMTTKTAIEYSTKRTKEHISNFIKLLDMVEEGKVHWKSVIENFYPDFEIAVKNAEKELEKIKIEDEVTDVICDECGRNMVVKYGPYGKFLACPGFPDCRNTKPYYEKIGVACPKCGGEIVMKKTKKGRKYYGCENNPECDFMSWQKPSAKKCPKCGNYMLEKGNKLVCSQETCGYVEQKPKDED